MLFTYHIVKLPLISAIRILFSPPKHTNGLIQAEIMSGMTLGAPVYSISRILTRQIVMFAQWEDEESLEHFLQTKPFGRKLTKGWYVKLLFLRQWGTISGFEIPKHEIEIEKEDATVVAVTIARMKLLEIPRFIRWGIPVEKLVGDHKGTTLSLASIRFPRTISTFSIWKTQQEMLEMVSGHSKVEKPKRHLDAMKERNRKDFHVEFTTLRFQPLEEYGTWEGKSTYTQK
jgi:hypothetical protein